MRKATSIASWAMFRSRFSVLFVGMIMFLVAMYTMCYNRWPSVKNKALVVRYLESQTRSEGTGNNDRVNTSSFDDKVSVHVKVGQLENKIEHLEVLLNEVIDHLTETEANNSQAVHVDDPSDYMQFIHNADPTSLQDPLLHKHKFIFALNNEHACHGDVFLLIAIHSAAGNQAARNAIRKTWGEVRFYSGVVIVPLFMVAELNTGAKITQTDLVDESKLHRDIIQGNFMDAYQNLTYKQAMVLHWTQHHCNGTQFILKVDDDVMIDIYHLVNFLFGRQSYGAIHNCLYCRAYIDHEPIRLTGDKWFVSMEVYPYTVYPPYCRGMAYIMSYNASSALYKASTRVPFFWAEDVYITGFLAALSGITHHDMENSQSTLNTMDSETLYEHVQRYIFFLAETERGRKQWDRAWKYIREVNKVVS